MRKSAGLTYRAPGALGRRGWAAVLAASALGAWVNRHGWLSLVGAGADTWADILQNAAGGALIVGYLMYVAIALRETSREYAVIWKRGDPSDREVAAACATLVDSGALARPADAAASEGQAWLVRAALKAARRAVD